MGEPRLSPREQQILTEIEHTLGKEGRLERELRTWRVSAWTKCLDGLRGVRSAALVVLALLCVILLADVLSKPGTGSLAAFATTVAATLALGGAVLHDRAHRDRP
ncbi:hypothetical protein [Streptomyces sp. HPF1205]|uniref:hypothetical protein n=1 Tax=Streptomyces sp. HPF1205 TaxID=2873262 RepID=UPI001CED2085|nr:hypothetical protein [Streptomyces sp. HPF1205]